MIEQVRVVAEGVEVGSLAEAIARQPLPSVGLGNGFALYPEDLHNGLGQGLEIWPEELGRPSAVALADLGRRALDESETPFATRSEESEDWRRRLEVPTTAPCGTSPTAAN